MRALRGIGAWVAGHRWQAALIVAVIVALPTGTALALAHYASGHPSAAAITRSASSPPPTPTQSFGPINLATATPYITPTATPSILPTDTSTPSSAAGSGDTPPARGAPQFAYDSYRHQAVLFGGLGPNGELNDTWLWDGKRWTAADTAETNPDQIPPAREGGAFIYDPVGHDMLMFGGWNYQQFFDDTWIWNGSQWRPFIHAIHPSARAFSGVAYDTAHQRVLLLGGWNQADFFTDMWSWNGLDWSQIQMPADTPKLNQVGLAYQRTTGHLVVVGEQGQGAGTAEGLQTWIYNGSSWSQEGTGSPCAHHYGGAAQNLDNDSIVVYGGECAVTNETATFDGTRWTIATPAIAPAPRGEETGGPGMTYDTDHHVVLLFGAKTPGGQWWTDTWAWDGSAWSKLA